MKPPRKQFCCTLLFQFLLHIFCLFVCFMTRWNYCRESCISVNWFVSAWLKPANGDGGTSAGQVPRGQFRPLHTGSITNKSHKNAKYLLVIILHLKYSEWQQHAICNRNTGTQICQRVLTAHSEEDKLDSSSSSSLNMRLGLLSLLSLRSTPHTAVERLLLKSSIPPYVW